MDFACLLIQAKVIIVSTHEKHQTYLFHIPNIDSAGNFKKLRCLELKLNQIQNLINLEVSGNNEFCMADHCGLLCSFRMDVLQNVQQVNVSYNFCLILICSRPFKGLQDPILTTSTMYFKFQSSINQTKIFVSNLVYLQVSKSVQTQ